MGNIGRQLALVRKLYYAEWKRVRFINVLHACMHSNQSFLLNIQLPHYIPCLLGFLFQYECKLMSEKTHQDWEKFWLYQTFAQNYIFVATKSQKGMVKDICMQRWWRLVNLGGGAVIHKQQMMCFCFAECFTVENSVLVGSYVPFLGLGGQTPARFIISIQWMSKERNNNYRCVCVVGRPHLQRNLWLQLNGHQY